MSIEYILFAVVYILTTTIKAEITIFSKRIFCNQTLVSCFGMYLLCK